MSARCSGASASQRRPAAMPSSSGGASRTRLPSPAIAAPGSPSRARPTAARSSGSRWRFTSFIVAVAMPAFCSRRKGCPASTAFNCLVSPTSTTRATFSARATRSSASMRTLPVIEASSTARTAPPYSARARASRSGSERSPKRVRKYCSVRVGMPASLARTRAATADGARPCIFRSPSSSFTSLSMVVLPLPAWPCTPITRSFDKSTVRTASLWPRVRRDGSSRASPRHLRRSPAPCPFRAPPASTPARGVQPSPPDR